MSTRHALEQVESVHQRRPLQHELPHMREQTCWILSILLRVVDTDPIPEEFGNKPEYAVYMIDDLSTQQIPPNVEVKDTPRVLPFVTVRADTLHAGDLQDEFRSGGMPLECLDRATSCVSRKALLKLLTSCPETVSRPQRKMRSLARPYSCRTQRRRNQSRSYQAAQASQMGSWPGGRSNEL